MELPIEVLQILNVNGKTYKERKEAFDKARYQRNTRDRYLLTIANAGHEAYVTLARDSLSGEKKLNPHRIKVLRQLMENADRNLNHAIKPCPCEYHTHLGDIDGPVVCISVHDHPELKFL